MPLLLLQRVALGEVLGDEARVDRAVDDDVRDMDPLRPELARHALGERAQRVLGAGERGEARRAAHARGRAGEDDRAAAARQHRLGDLAAHQEAGERAHLPHLAVDALGRLGDREAHVRADVEDRDLDRRDLALDVRDQRLDVDLLARVGAEAVRRAAVGADLRHERLELVGAAPGDARDIALAREAARDRAAGGVAGADHEYRLCCRLHIVPHEDWGRRTMAEGATLAHRG